jgi:hypothetical protein
MLHIGERSGLVNKKARESWLLGELVVRRTSELTLKAQ